MARRFVRGLRLQAGRQVKTNKKNRRPAFLLREMPMPVRSLAELQLDELIRNKEFTPSPTAWEDEVLYFLLVDRFSDGNEKGYRGLDGNVVNTGTTELFQPGDALNAVKTPENAARWREAGAGYVGGKLAGITSKLGYLGRLGVTAIWLSPVLKQVAFQQTYHGYGIQDYLQVNPRFGTADDLRTLVDTAHANGMRVILDIILNHTGNVFSYNPDRYLTSDSSGRQFLDARWDGYRVDTVKHMDLGAARVLGSSMKEFAARIGKDNFYLIAEITGGRSFAFDTLGITGLDAALGIDDIPDKLEFLAKGYRDPGDYFGLFRNSELVGQGSHTWFRNKVVTLFNDHDQVSKGSNKARFCADKDKAKGVVAALALNAMTLGIPCIYYGTEQLFDGHGSGDGADRYI